MRSTSPPTWSGRWPCSGDSCSSARNRAATRSRLCRGRDRLRCGRRLISENARVLMDQTPEAARETASERSRRSAPPSSCGGCACGSRPGATSPMWWSQSLRAGGGRGPRRRHAVERPSRGRCPRATWSYTSSRAGAGSTFATGCSPPRWPSRSCREAHDITIFEHDGQASVSLHLKLPDDLVAPRTR